MTSGSAGTPSLRRASLRACAICALLALAVAALLLVDFSPRFVYWRGLNVRGTRLMPEFARGIASTEQLDKPWGAISDPIFLVLRWRLLFPMIWYFLALPKSLYLAMPFVGCVLTLWLIAWLTYCRLGNWVATVLTTILCGALPWFFVSTGWLAYFDSWLVLGLLTVAFVADRRALAAACLLTPWVDERFLFALPVCLLVRAAALDTIANRDWSSLRRDLAAAIAASAPYGLIRAAAWLYGDAGSTAYVHFHWTHVRNVPLRAFVKGIWSGYRAAWLLFPLVLWLWARRVGWGWSALLAAITAVSVVGGLFIAADMSRTMTIVLPVLLLSIWLWEAWRPTQLRWVLPALVLANLFIPAAHVMWGIEIPISHLPTEIAAWQHPPSFIAAAERIAEAQSLMDRGKLAEARNKLDESIALDPDYPGAYTRRAILQINAGDMAAAAPDVDQALRLLPDDPYLLFLHGVVSQSRGDIAAAERDFRRALELAPRDWPQRAEVERMLGEMRNGAPR